MAVVLVTDGEERSALATVRSLGKAGHDIVVLSSENRTSLAGWSRWASARHSGPSSLDRPGAFVETVIRVVEERGVEVVLPMTEASLVALADEREAVRPATIPFPGLETVKRATRKDKVNRAAASVGLAVPKELILGGREEAEGVDLEQVGFPMVVKAARSVVESGGVRIKTPGAAYAADAEELRAILSKVPDEAYPLLLQERVVGPGMGIFLLVWNDQVYARFGHRRIREKPPSGGVSVLRESVQIPDAWFEAAEELLRGLGWYGVAMVELKVDSASGSPYLMEINPRFWGSLQLAIDSGVNFPAALVELTLGHTVSKVVSYTLGIQTRWMWGDVDNLVARLRRPIEGNRAVAGGRRSDRWQAVKDFVTGFGPGVRQEVERWSDPLPAVAETTAWLRRK